MKTFEEQDEENKKLENFEKELKDILRRYSARMEYAIININGKKYEFSF